MSKLRKVWNAVTSSFKPIKPPKVRPKKLKWKTITDIEGNTIKFAPGAKLPTKNQYKKLEASKKKIAKANKKKKKTASPSNNFSSYFKSGGNVFTGR